MAINLTMNLVEPFLPPLKESQQERVEAWLSVLQVILNARYGAGITQEPDGGNEPMFLSAAADAIERRLARPGMVLQQNIGPAGVRYDPRATLARWFLPEQLDELDAVAGFGGVRSVRTPAPDAIRYGNRANAYADTVDESGEGDVIIGSI